MIRTADFSNSNLKRIETADNGEFNNTVLIGTYVYAANIAVPATMC